MATPLIRGHVLAGRNPQGRPPAPLRWQKIKIIASFK
jgi:hypothetical protein